MISSKMKHLFSFGLLTAGLISGCYADLESCPNGYAIDPAFTQSEREIIFDSGRRWNKFAGQEVVKFNGSTNANGCGIMRINTKEDYLKIKSRREYEDNFRGVDFRRTGTIFISMFDNPSERVTKNTVMHELGHELGLNHTRSGVMFKTATGNFLFSKDDFDECVLVGACLMSAGGTGE